MRTKVFTGAGLALLLGAALALLLTGRTQVRVSADEEAGTVGLALVLVPVLVGLALIRLVPPRLPALPQARESAPPAGRSALVRQAVGLVLLAVAFPVLVVVLRAAPGGDLLYGPVKVLVLLGGGWLVLRRTATGASAPSPARAHQGLLPRRWYWLGPVPAVLGWGYLYFYSPLAGDRDVSGYESWDPVELAIVATFTFLTASVTEEIFYRVLLQTRLEALVGRWAAITATALLFALMHVHRLGDGPFWETTALVLAFNGGFGLFVGYLWSRYRNVWSLIVVHGAVNALALLPILLR